ncbi:hypothetical protein N9W79_01000 [bacterium]|nr:hypothetical protein [bacterium]
MTNGSRDYFGVVFTLALCAVIDNKLYKSKRLFLAAGVFALALAFRSLDMKYCLSNPYGLHFLWHTLVGLVVYVLGSRFEQRIKG